MKNRKLMITAAVAIRKRCGGMNNMTNRWIGVMMALVFAGMVTSARGGSLDAPAGPTSSASAMYTLQDIYNYLTTGVRASKRIGGFTEPTAGPTVGTMHTLNEIMEAGIIPQKTGQTNSYAVGDDGTNQIGLAWPNPRFTVVGAPGTLETNQIRDNLTGLIWAQNALNAGAWASAKTNWDAAVTNCNNLDYGGTNDWRLPNMSEFLSLVNRGQVSPGSWLNTQGCFTDVQSANSWALYYWSSTTYAASTDCALVIWLYTGNGASDYLNKTSKYYVWPVRGGQ